MQFYCGVVTTLAVVVLTLFGPWTCPQIFIRGTNAGYTGIVVRRTDGCTKRTIEAEAQVNRRIAELEHAEILVLSLRYLWPMRSQQSRGCI